ncbi:MAG TPA: type 4a pilus biogenesis protein PilO, partial [Burkholderiaceae bacterium]
RGLSGRHPGLWPLVPRLFCGLGVMLGVVVGGYLLYWSGQIDEQEAGAAEEVKLKDEFKLKIGQAINLEALRAQKAQVSQYVASLEKQLPSKAEMDALLTDINQAGVGRGLQFEAFVPGQATVKDYYAELPIDIKISGKYHEIGAFTGDIANLSRIVTLNNLSLQTGQNGVLTLDAIAKTFRYLDPEEVAAQRKAAQEAAKAKKGKK